MRLIDIYPLFYWKYRLFRSISQNGRIKTDIDGLSDDLKNYINKGVIEIDKIIILALPVVPPTIKGFEIIEGDIEVDKNTDKRCLSTVTDKFLFNKILSNDIIIPTIHANIKVTS